MAVDIKKFLEARIAEDEVYARQVIDATWCDHLAEWRCDSSAVVTTGQNDLDQLQTVCCSSVSYHIARFDPSRVLDEVAAKRAVIEMYESLKPETADMFTEFMPRSAVSGAREALERTLVALAATYSSHPDYDPEWAVK